MPCSLINKPTSKITEEDLQRLVDEDVCERLDLEYKRDLPGVSKEAKEEFLADVSAFANSQGGLLIFGISTDGGVPDKLVGVEIVDEDEDKLRLTNRIREGIDPRLSGYELIVLHLPSGKQMLLIDIHRSWIQPHMVTFGKYRRFYRRTSSGKECMSTGQLRETFLQGSGAEDRARDFLRERLGMIMTGEAPVVLPRWGKLVLHLVPLGELSAPVDLSRFRGDLNGQRPNPLTGDQQHQTFCLDGYVTYNQLMSDEQLFAGYALMFRSGALEVVESEHMKTAPKYDAVPLTLMERCLLKRLPGYLDLQSKVGVVSPVVLFLSFLSMAGYSCELGTGGFRDRPKAIMRDQILLPSVVVDVQDRERAVLERAIKPIFDALWNTWGYPGSTNFGADDRWRGSNS